MNKRLLLLSITTLCFVNAAPRHHHPPIHVGPRVNASFTDLAELSAVTISSDDNFITISSNAIPNHTTGDFPNAGNPNSITPQNLTYRVTRYPVKNTTSRPHLGTIGIAINGVPFEPGTAECYDGRKGPSQPCDWREEAIISGQSTLGLDENNAHVQPTGLYHYHGIPTGLVQLDTSHKEDLVFVGYAADGFKLLVSLSNQFQSSYRLKSGVRPNGPGGRYDGKYTQDFMYVDGVGDLDACNGKTFADGSYAYILTDAFPFVPRCLYGTADNSFNLKKR